MKVALGQVVAELEGQVGRRDAIVAARELGVGDERSHVVRAAQGVLPPGDVVVLPLAEEGVLRLAGELLAGGLVAGGEKGERGAAGGAARLASPQRVLDHPGVDGGPHVRVPVGSGELERPHPLHEERPLLRVEDRKALVHLHLEGVALHLAEVGVDRALDRGRRREPVLDREPGVRFRVGGTEGVGAHPRLVPRVGGARDHLEGERLLHVVERHGGVALDEALAGRDVGPGGRHSETAHATPEQDAHPDLAAALEANGGEGQPDLDVVPLGRPPARALPHPVGGRVLARARRRQDVGLHAGGVDEEIVRALAVADRVEAQAHPVVVPELVATAERAADLGRLGVQAPEGEVDRPVVVRDPDLRGLRRACPR